MIYPINRHKFGKLNPIVGDRPFGTAGQDRRPSSSMVFRDCAARIKPVSPCSSVCRSLRDYTDDATVTPCRLGGHDRGGGYILLSVNPVTADHMPRNPPCCCRRQQCAGWRARSGGPWRIMMCGHLDEDFSESAMSCRTSLRSERAERLWVLPGQAPGRGPNGTRHAADRRCTPQALPYQRAQGRVS